MSRSSTVKFNDKKIVVNTPMRYNKNPRILLIDADSLLFTCTYSPDEELTFEEVCYRTREKISEISLIVEDSFNIQETILFIGCTDNSNFRYKLYPEYKSNRKLEKPKWFNELKSYILNELNAISSDGAESDDYIYHTYKLANEQCVVVTLDKDLNGFTPGFIYNYKLRKFNYINKEESRLFFCKQLITGDSGDGVNMCPGKGPKYAEKILKLGMSDYQFKKMIFKTYVDAWQGNTKVAKEKLVLCYNLLKLHTLDEIKLIKNKINLMI